MTVPDLKTALRSLLLPIAEENYDRAVESAAEALMANGVREDDFPQAVRAYYDEWRETGVPPGGLVDIVRDALDAEPLIPDSFSRSYFKTHASLVSKTLMTFDGARGLLSNAILIAHLLQQSLSCAQIANTISGAQSAAGYSWQQVQRVARSLGSVPTLNQPQTEALTRSDKEREGERFADASPLDAVEILAMKAHELGFRGDISVALKQFYEDFAPQYSVILHANALAVEFFDHPPQEAAYEFKPRGGPIEWLQSVHPSYTATQSAYLNNSKGASAFDSNWAWGRQPSLWGSAHALSRILGGLGEMPYSGRRELCGWLRQWLLRIERDRAGTTVDVSRASLQEAEAFLENASRGNTATAGVLDQRFLDFFLPAQFESRAGWVSRGVGDHVNASNTSKLKLGDLEFENSGDRIIRAFEAHGGILTDIYVAGHKASLRNVLRRRSESLLAVAAAQDWEIRVCFVAHALDVSEPAPEVIEGFTVAWEFRSYADMLEDALQYLHSSPGLDEFNNSVVRMISPTYVPDRVKRKYLQLAHNAQVV